MQLVDTHCHIHEAQFELNSDNPTRALWLRDKQSSPDEMISEALADGVAKMICVGTTLEDSDQAIQFVQDRDSCWASIGLHPHEASKYVGNSNLLKQFSALVAKNKVVAVGECGLDFYYNHSPKKDQIAILEFQLDLAQKNQKPVIFHIRDAFNDFWPILDNFPGTRGVVHSFTAHLPQLEQILSRGLHVGLNGIMTFTKDNEQLEAAKAVPLQKLLLETDAPFLTPAPFRGTICKPKFVRLTAEFLSSLRGEPLEALSDATTTNAETLFNLR